MLNSQGDSIVNFANRLVNQLVLEAMNILDANNEDADNYRHRFHGNRAISGYEICKDHKIRYLPLRIAQQRHQRVERTISCQGDQVRSSYLSEFSPNAIQSNDLCTRDANMPVNMDQRASEEIRKIVQGLQGVQIGDSSLVKPVTQVPSLEIQVKRAVQEISSVSENLEINEVPIIEGQGDVHDRILSDRIPFTAIAEVNNQIENSSLEGLEMLEEDNSGNESQVQQLLQQQQRDVSKLRSTCFLHRIIKELENAEGNQENILKVSNSISGISQERIAVWEENEEKFIRIIEDSKEESLEKETNDFFAISLIEEVPDGSIANVINHEINSKPVSPATSPIPSPPLPQAIQSAPSSSSQCLGVEREAILLPQNEAKVDKKKIKRKIRLGERLRHLFRSAFKRGKDC